MLTGKAKTDYQHKYMTGYMRNYRKNKDSVKLSQKQGLKNAPESPAINEQQSAKVFTRSLHNTEQVFTDKSKVFTKPVRPPNISDNQYAMICVKAEREANK